MTGPSLAFIGLGAIGAPIAERFLKAGFPLTVSSRRRVSGTALVERGAEWADTAGEAAERAEIVFTCLPGLEADEEIYFGEKGILSGGKPRCVVNLATTGPEAALSAARRLEAAGIGFVDAPVTGGVPRAREGKLTVIAAGRRSLIELASPAFSAIASDVFVVGPEPGQAQKAKLINNMLNFTALVATCEAIVTGTKAGLDPKVLVDIVNTGSGRNSATEAKFPMAILPRTFDYGATNALACKDLSLFLELAENVDMPAPVAAHVFQLWRGWTSGRQAEDFTTIVKMYEAWGELTLPTLPRN